MTKVAISELSDDDFDFVSSEKPSLAVSPLLQSATASPSRSRSQSSQPAESPQPRITSIPESHQYADFSLAAEKSLDGLLANDDFAEMKERSPNRFGDRISQLSRTVSSAVKNHMDWSSKVVLIAVMGMTGSGKTTFISRVTGRDDLKIGHDLTSCTQEIQVIETKIGDQVVRFVDTPGFSDTYLSDTEVLEMIADYLAAAYTQDVKLSGIIYLHPISDNRVTHHATKNLEMFRKLTGEGNLKNVVLTTSMWDKVTPEQGAKREAELKQKFWSLLLAFNAKTDKYTGTAESAISIAKKLLKNKPFYLQLQQEMGKDNKALRDTAAGREVMAEIEKMKAVHQRELDEMKAMMAKTSEEQNRAAMEALEAHYRGMVGEMERTLQDERRMNEAAVRSLTERIKALESKGVCAVM